MIVQWISVNKTYYAIHWIVIYPVDSVYIHPLNNRASSTKSYYSCRIVMQPDRKPSVVN